ncbi:MULTISPECIES: Stf0 family sulfotransferase [Sphingomonas]|uniref:LPS sulfotransferase NodH n=1 Tax=Sphingomonas kyeonggiensis TaxID=1268553 RepID=A0A7W7NSC9_9SPHN|nr:MULTISPECIES: Stf0 family sulfotransferase [Sphingomonas]MBB4838742.1 LPS sulfotransferase NodH [Sphingomonas kyeonggiensis]WHU04028.1 Stf0 family sulfotransferase [Sphingomonas sp. NIBR02145]
MRGYALCGEPRSGTTFLKQAIASTGVLGHPFEWFHPRFEAQLGKGESLLDMMMARASSDNGVYGLKIFSVHARVADRWRWVSDLPNLSFVHITRADLLDQAISLARAAQTSRYESSAGEARPAAYDRAQITATLKDIARGQARWSVWFATHGIRPLSISYDEIVDKPQDVVTRIADLVGVSDVQIDWSKVSGRVMRDELSAEWKQRYLAEAGPVDRIAELEDGSLPGIARSVLRALR